MGWVVCAATFLSIVGIAIYFILACLPFRRQVRAAKRQDPGGISGGGDEDGALKKPLLEDKNTTGDNHGVV